VIIPDAEHKSVSGGSPNVEDKSIVAVQAKNTRLNLLLAGQAYYSRALLLNCGARSVRSVAACRVSQPGLEGCLAARAIEVRELPRGRPIASASFPFDENRIRQYHEILGGALHLQPMLGGACAQPHAVIIPTKSGETRMAALEVEDLDVIVIAAPVTGLGMFAGGTARFGADVALARGAQTARPVVLAPCDDAAIRPILEDDGVSVIVQDQS
jgi:hypothetical protein